MVSGLWVCSICSKSEFSLSGGGCGEQHPAEPGPALLGHKLVNFDANNCEHHRKLSEGGEGMIQTNINKPRQIDAAYFASDASVRTNFVRNLEVMTSFWKYFGAFFLPCSLMKSASLCPPSSLEILLRIKTRGVSTRHKFPLSILSPSQSSERKQLSAHSNTGYFSSSLIFHKYHLLSCGKLKNSGYQTSNSMLMSSMLE